MKEWCQYPWLFTEACHAYRKVVFPTFYQLRYNIKLSSRYVTSGLLNEKGSWGKDENALPGQYCFCWVFICENFLTFVFYISFFSKFFNYSRHTILISGVLQGNTFNVLGSLPILPENWIKAVYLQRKKMRLHTQFCSKFQIFHRFQILEASCRPCFLTSLHGDTLG